MFVEHPKNAVDTSQIKKPAGQVIGVAGTHPLEPVVSPEMVSPEIRLEGMSTHAHEAVKVLIIISPLSLKRGIELGIYQALRWWLVVVDGGWW